jgi:hypothetical protein
MKSSKHRRRFAALLCTLLFLGVACRRPPSPPPGPPPTEASAQAAYDAKQYATCAAQFEALAKTDGKEQWAHDHYSAACCHALDGKVDAAFAALARATEAGWKSVEWMQNDADLASLRADARWAKAVAATEAALAAWDKTLPAPELRRDHIARAKVDLAARHEIIADQRANGGRPGVILFNKVQKIDHENTEALKAAIAKYGWPGNKLVGEEAAHDAFLLAQHADQDPAFQKQALALMEPLVKTGEVLPRNYAYLYDRVAVAEKRPQRYGTQFNGSEPQPIEDEANVDARRKEVGLGTMAEYRKEMERTYGKLPPPSPSPQPPVPPPSPSPQPLPALPPPAPSK